MTEKRPAARTFREFVVWQKAHRFVLSVYALTAGFPKSETYGLSLQMRKAAVSIPANIRRLSPAWQSRQGSLSEHLGEFSGGESILPDPDGRFGVWQHRGASGFPARSQSIAARIFASDSGFFF